MKDITQWQEQVALVLKKYTKRLLPEDREDMEQEAWVALLEVKKIDGAGHAYTIARNRVLYTMRQRGLLQSRSKESEHFDRWQFDDAGEK